MCTNLYNNGFVLNDGTFLFNLLKEFFQEKMILDAKSNIWSLYMHVCLYYQKYF